MRMHDRRRLPQFDGGEPDLRNAAESGTFLRIDPSVPVAKRESRAQRSRERSWDLRWRVFSASPIPMFIFLRTDGAIVAANDAAVREYGWTQEELLEANIADLVPPVDRFVDKFLRHAHRQTKWAEALLHRRKDGTSFHADLGMLQAGVTDSATMAVVVKRDAHPHA
ncbi:MAG TPA: PAS domain-containing protein [Polyangiaceae bacterium]